MKKLPPNGSIVLVIPVSSAKINCVFLAILAENCVGKAKASSNEFV